MNRKTSSEQIHAAELRKSLQLLIKELETSIQDSVSSIVIVRGNQRINVQDRKQKNRTRRSSQSQTAP